MSSMPPPAHTPMNYPPQKSGGGGGKLILGGCLGCGGVALLIIIAIVAFFVWAASLPTTAVQTHATTPANVVEALQSSSLLDPDEQIIMIYSAGVTSMKVDGFYFTDRRVVSYMDADDASSATQATYDEIVDIVLEISDSFVEDSLIVVELKDGSIIVGAVNNFDGEDRKFHNRLVQEWKDRGGQAP